MLKTIQRYLAFSFIPPFVISSVFFVAFLLTFQLFRITNIVITKGVSAIVVLELVGHIAISLLPMAMPLSALFATMFTLNKLSEDSEIIAMRSFGTDKLRLFTPFLILGLLIAIGIFSLNQNLIPYSKKISRNMLIRLTSRGLLTDIKAEQFFTEIPGATIFAEKVSGEGKRLEDVFIHLKNRDGDEEKVIFARQGILIKQQAGEWDLPTIRMNLKDGNITKTYHSKMEVEKIIFQEYDFPVLTGKFRPGFITKDSMRTNGELLKIMSANPDPLKKGTDGRVNKAVIKTYLEFWARINTPIQCVIFVLLGFGLGIKQGRGSRRSTGVIVLVILLIYYSVFFVGISLSRKGILPPSFSILLPTIIAFLVGGYYYKKLDWIS